jgi:uncharacterized membrane protein YfcA
VDRSHLPARWRWWCLAVAAVRRQDILARGTLAYFDGDAAVSVRQADFRALRVRGGGKRPSPLVMAGLAIPLFFCALYGGFFGGGLGVVMMPVLSLTGVKDMQQLNGLKNLLVTAMTCVAVLTFVASGAVSWPGTVAMLAGALIGGYAGGYLARHIPATLLKKIVIALGFALSVYYFGDVYFR